MNRSIKYPLTPNDWNQRFLYTAASVASWSKDPSTRVGAVAVSNRRILATGYNGFPAGVLDMSERLGDRDLRLAMTVHAEQNLLAYAARAGVCLAGSTVYIYPLMACSSCAAMLINADVHKIVVPDILEPMRWQNSFDLSRQMCTEAGVIVERVLLEGPLAIATSPQRSAEERHGELEEADLRIV